MGIMDELKKEVSKCKRCPDLVASRTQTVFGDGNPKSGILFVGEAPGADEDKEGIPFVGRAGKLLSNALAEIGIDRTHYYITNVIKCRPEGNRDPQTQEIVNCSGFLASQLVLFKPKIIVTLGRFGLHTMVNKTYKISEVHGRQIRSKDGIIFFPMYHPSAALRSPQTRELFETDIQKFRKLLQREGLL
jgi:uracil-DNA glycosylase